MAILKKKTRKAIQKSVSKALNKHGPTLATHLATGLATGLAAYLGAEPTKGKKKLKKAAKALPVKKIGKALAAVPGVKEIAQNVAGLDINGERKTAKRAKKSSPE